MIGDLASATCRRVGDRGSRRQGRAPRRLGEAAARGAELATTTSSLPVAEIGARSGTQAGCFGAPRLQPGAEDGAGRALLPGRADADGAASAPADCARRWARPRSRYPTQPGFVVNRLLFPYLFDAVRLIERTGMERRRRRRLHDLGRRPPDGPAARCSTSSASTSRRRSGRRSTPTPRVRPQAPGSAGRDGRRAQARAQERRRLLRVRLIADPPAPVPLRSQSKR